MRPADCGSSAILYCGRPSRKYGDKTTLSPLGVIPLKHAAIIGSSSWICNAQAEDGYRRLDATFYAPEARRAICRIKEAGGHGTLADHGCMITLLGKTFIPGVHKVEREWGMPYFTGKELITARIAPTTFIASQKYGAFGKVDCACGYGTGHVRRHSWARRVR